VIKGIMDLKEKIDLITRISMDLTQVRDLDILLEKILANVRQFLNADAGSIYLKDGNSLKFNHSQNNTLQKALLPGKKLIYNTYTVPVDTKSIAGYVAMYKKPVSIPDVYDLPSSVPYAFDSEFDIISGYKSKSMLTVPIIDQKNDTLGVMQIINCMDTKGNIIPFSDSDQPLVMHFAANAGLAIERAQATRNILLRMISMAELRDPKETGAHVNRVGAYSVEIYEAWAKQKGIPQEEIEKQKDLLRMAAMLHDVGKVAISDLILKKPARLTIDEYEIIKSHTWLGAKLFKDSQSDFDAVAMEVALNHHEKWDGTGYPGFSDEVNNEVDMVIDEGIRLTPKRGFDIPLFGRIVALADVYDALSSQRVYKKPWDEYEIINEIKKCSGSHFDPDIVAAFFKCYDILKTISKKYADHQ
jgi:HD-GYP domain-containing protein (c-di-GMP phosphodiesterase class II)